MLPLPALNLHPNFVLACPHIKRFLPAKLWALLVLALTGVPGKYIPRVTRFIDWLSPDKAAHLLLFGVLAFLTAYGFRESFSQAQKRSSITLFVLVSGIVYGGLTELLQSYVFIGRDGNLYDFLADVLGTLLGFGIFLFWHKKNRPRAIAR